MLDQAWKFKFQTWETHEHGGNLKTKCNDYLHSFELIRNKFQFVRVIALIIIQGEFNWFKSTNWNSNEDITLLTYVRYNSTLDFKCTNPIQSSNGIKNLYRMEICYWIQRTCSKTKFNWTDPILNEQKNYRI